MALTNSLTRDLTRGLTRSLTRAAAGATDANFSSVVLLLDFAGADGATNITDLSNSAHNSETFVGNAQVDTAQQFLAKNSLLLDGTGDFVDYPDSADWVPGSGAVTWECGIRFNTAVAAGAFISHRGASNSGMHLSYTGTMIRVGRGGSIISQQTWSPVIDTWYHVAVCRDGNNWRFFVDGTQVGSTVADVNSIGGSGNTLTLGANPDNSSPLNGHIGAVRLTKGVARYTENFVPPVIFYPTS